MLVSDTRISEYVFKGRYLLVESQQIVAATALTHATQLHFMRFCPPLVNGPHG